MTTASRSRGRWLAVARTFPSLALARNIARVRENHLSHLRESPRAFAGVIARIRENHPSQSIAHTRVGHFSRSRQPSLALASHFWWVLAMARLCRHAIPLRSSDPLIALGRVMFSLPRSSRGGHHFALSHAQDSAPILASTFRSRARGKAALSRSRKVPLGLRESSLVRARSFLSRTRGSRSPHPWDSLLASSRFVSCQSRSPRVDAGFPRVLRDSLSRPSCVNAQAFPGASRVLGTVFTAWREVVDRLGAFVRWG